MKQITGIWMDPKGNLAAYGVLHCQLNQDATVRGTNQIAPRQVAFNLNANGALRVGARIWANDELDPTNTYYTLAVTAYGGGLIWGPVRLILSGPGPININALIPINTVPVQDQNASLSVVTSPTLVAGQLNGSITSNGSFLTNLVTVSDQLVLFGGQNISLLGSVSGQSMTITIQGVPGVIGGSVFSFIANGSTVTNALLLSGGSNISLAGSTDSNGMSLSINGLAGTQTGPSPTVALFAGSNVTLASASNTGGSSWTINATGGTGSTTIVSNPAFSGGANGQLVSNQLMLTGGSNITLATATNASGMTVSINGAAGGTGGGGANPLSLYLVPGVGTVQGTTSAGNVNNISFIAESNIVLNGGLGSVGQTGAMEILIGVSNLSGTTSPLSVGGTAIAGGSFGGAGGFAAVQSLEMVAGSNVTLSMADSTGPGGPGKIVTIHGGAGGGHIFSAGIGAVSPVIATNQFILVAGSNITFDYTTNTAGMTVSIDGNAGAAQQSNLNGVLFNAGGTVAGVTNINGINDLFLCAGSNILLSATSSGTATTEQAWQITIAAHTGTAASVSLVAGSNVVIEPGSDSGGSTFTIHAVAAGTGTGAGGAYLFPGNNNIWGTTSGASTSIAGGMVVGIGTNWGGSQSFNVSAASSQTNFRLLAGANLSANFSTSAGIPGQAQITLNAPYGYLQSFAAGSNVTINSSLGTLTNQSTLTTGVTYTINAAQPLPLPVDKRIMRNVFPIFPTNTTIASLDIWKSGPMFWPIDPGLDNASYSSACMFMSFGMNTSVTGYGSLSLYMAVYEQGTDLALHLDSSASRYYVWTCNSLNTINYVGMKLVKIPFNPPINFGNSLQNYWMAFRATTSSSSQSFGVSALACDLSPTANAASITGNAYPFNEFGADPSIFNQPLLGWGYLPSGLNSFPPVVSFSQLWAQDQTMIPVPLTYLLASTT